MYPYTKFGFNLWRLREARGKSAKDMSQYLNISTKEYQNFEMGKCLPSDEMLLEISRLLKEEISTLKHWTLFATTKSSKGKTDKNLHPLLGQLEKNIETLSQDYEKNIAKLSHEQKQTLEKIKNSLTKIIDLSVLPMNFILINDALCSVESKQYKYLHEYQNFITRGENLASFISRDLYYGPYIFYAANLLFFSDKPFQNISECLNSLSLEQFKELFTLATLQNGIYNLNDDIPRLQQHADFSSLACIFARELRKELEIDPPQNINFDHVYQACLLQGVGQYVLFEKLKPSLRGTGEETVIDEEEAEIFLGLDAPFFKHILWALHPIASAIMAANWSFPQEILEILMTHHNHPVSQVNANCALLKIINFFVDKDFPKLSKADLEDLLKAYPQVKIPPESLFEVCIRMNHIKNDLYERSSTLIEEGNKTIEDLTNEFPKSTKKTPHISKKEEEMPLKGSDFRFHSDYQDTLKSVAQRRYENLILDLVYPRKGEPLKKLGERVINFNLKLRYTLVKSIDDVAEEFKMQKEEIKIRLGLK